MKTIWVYVSDFGTHEILESDRLWAAVEEHGLVVYPWDGGPAIHIPLDRVRIPPAPKEPFRARLRRAIKILRGR